MKLQLRSEKHGDDGDDDDDDDDEDEDEDEDQTEDDQGEGKEDQEVGRQRIGSAMPGESGDQALPNGDEGSGGLGGKSSRAINRK